jgi:hypothetical protein
VDLLEQGDKPLLMDLPLLFGQGFTCTELLQNVVHIGDREPRMQLLLAFAVGIEPLAEIADAGFLLLCGIGEWEGIEAACFQIARIISNTKATTSCKSPNYM